MLKRKAYDFYLEWKKRKDRNFLLIKGAGQVSKTFWVEQFVIREYNGFIQINF